MVDVVASTFTYVICYIQRMCNGPWFDNRMLHISQVITIRKELAEAIEPIRKELAEATKRKLINYLWIPMLC